MTAVLAGTTPSDASHHPKVRGKANFDNFSLVANRALRGARHRSGNARGPTGERQSPSSSAGYRHYTVVPTCVAFGTAHTCRTGSSRCTIQRSLISGFWGARPNATCATTPTTTPAAVAAGAPPAAPPQVTPGLVATALARLPLPTATAHPQPDTKTLVNFDTIFHTDAGPVERTVTLLGQIVTIQATPNTYTWHYGDGTTATTSTPGTPYSPGDDTSTITDTGAGSDTDDGDSGRIVHRYTTAHVTAHPSVDLTYTGRYHLTGGPWATIPGTVTITGPTSPLRISEATPLLSGTG